MNVLVFGTSLPHKLNQFCIPFPFLLCDNLYRNGCKQIVLNYKTFSYRFDSDVWRVASPSFEIM